MRNMQRTYYISQLFISRAIYISQNFFKDKLSITYILFRVIQVKKKITIRNVPDHLYTQSYMRNGDKIINDPI